jgi:hypothetical protein
MVKSAVNHILGKTIKGVVMKRNSVLGPPNEQLFLVFTDGTYYEFYIGSGSFATTGGVDPGGLERVRQYLSPPMEIFYEAFLDDDGNVQVPKVNPKVDRF